MKKQTLQNLLVKTLLCSAFVMHTVLPVQAEGEQLDYNPYVGGDYNCTWTVWNAVSEAGYHLPGWHNAGTWAMDAALQGYTVTDVPAKYAISVWSNHVAFVEDISEDGTQVFIEEGGASIGHKTWWIDASSDLYGMPFIGYIYLPITEPEKLPVPEVPAETLLDHAENINIYVNPERLAETVNAQKQRGRYLKAVSEEQSKVLYVDRITDPVKADEPDVSTMSRYARLLSETEMSGQGSH